MLRDKLVPAKDPIEMSAKRYKAEKIITKFHQVDLLNAQGKSITEAIQSIGETKVTYCQWRSEYGLLTVSGRRAYRVLSQHRSTRSKIAKPPGDEAALIADITVLALQYYHYGYRHTTAMLPQAGWIINVKPSEANWQREGLKLLRSNRSADVCD